MRTIIAGSRGITDYGRLCRAVERSGIQPRTIISGGARGVDELSIRYAEFNKITCVVIRADWKRFGRAAGPMRNALMAEDADALIAIWDGKSRGTEDMIAKATLKGLKIEVHMVMK